MDDEQVQTAKRVANQAVGRLIKLGVPLFGAWELAVRGRSSGQWRTAPVNPVSVKGATYLLAPRGVTDWVRNLRVAGGGELRRLRTRNAFTAQEIPDADKPDVLRVYLGKWGWQVKQHFNGVTADSPAAELLDVAPDHPVFRIRWADPDGDTAD